MRKDYHVVQDREGNAVVGAEVYVRKQSDNTLVTLYSDDGVTTTANPLTTNNDGQVSFYAANATLKHQVYVDGVQQAEFNNIQHFDLDNISTFMWALFEDETAAEARVTLGAAASGANTDLTSVYLNNTGLKIKDTNASHGLTIAPGSDLTADRTFTLTTGDAARTLDISAANVTVSAFGASILDDADAATVRSTIGAAASGAVTSSGLTMATSRLLGRTTASSGAVEEISVGSGLSLSGGALSVSSGSSFPVSPSDGQRFWHTGLKFDFYWDNAVGQWLTVQEFQFPLYSQGALNNISATTFQMAGAIMPYTADLDVYVNSVAVVTMTNSANNASNYMSVTLYNVTTSAGTSIGTFSTQNDANTDTWVHHEVSVGAVWSKDIKEVHYDVTETGTVVGFKMHASMGCRLVGA